jgi:hypothetical protein
MGIFGFLSKAHNDQNLVSGDVQSKIAIYEEKIKTARENIETDRKQLRQMDDAVDQVLGRSTDEKGADKANKIRKSQQVDRNALLNDIETNQKLVAKLTDEEAPIKAENRKVEAEVGPIKYIAAFVYGSNPDSNVLEKAVTWIIIVIVVVFDPLAVIMLLASQMTFGWILEERRIRKEQEKLKIVEKPVATIEEIIQEFRDQGLALEEPEVPFGDRIHSLTSYKDDLGINEPCPKCGTTLIDVPGIGFFCPNKDCEVIDDYMNWTEIVSELSKIEDIEIIEDPV